MFHSSGERLWKVVQTVVLSVTSPISLFNGKLPLICDKLVVDPCGRGIKVLSV